MPNSSLDFNVFSLVGGLATLWLSNLTLWFTIPETNRYRTHVFVVSNIIILVLFTMGIYLGISPSSLAIQTLGWFYFILLMLAIIASIVYVINTQQNRQNMPQSIQQALAHIDDVIYPFYSRKDEMTFEDKREAMSAILRQIALTTVPTDLESLTRISLFELRDDGKFRILATNNIDAHRISQLEERFQYHPKPIGTVGKCALEKRPILRPDLTTETSRKDANWEPTPENEMPHYSAKSIICVPVLDEDKCLAVISISSSKRSYFTTEHQDQLGRYASRARNLLITLNKSLLIDPDEDYGIKAITISGEVGSGKTTLAAALSYMLPGWRRVSFGERFRKFCADRGLTEQHINQVPDEIHREFDEYQRLMLQQEEKIILESRLSGYLAAEMPDVLKIFCKLPLEQRIERTAQREDISFEMAREKLLSRDEGDRERYRHLYDIDDYRVGDHYFYLNTDGSPDSLARQVIHQIRANNRSKTS